MPGKLLVLFNCQSSPKIAAMCICEKTLYQFNQPSIILLFAFCPAHTNRQLSLQLPWVWVCGAVPCALGCCPSCGHLPVSFPLLTAESVPAPAQCNDSKPGTWALARGLQPCGKCLRAGMGSEVFRGASWETSDAGCTAWGLLCNFVPTLWMGSPRVAPGTASA